MQSSVNEAIIIIRACPACCVYDNKAYLYNWLNRVLLDLLNLELNFKPSYKLREHLCCENAIMKSISNTMQIKTEDKFYPAKE